MLIRAFTLVLAIAASVIADNSQCDAGYLQCCDETVTADEGTNYLTSLLGIATDPVEGLIGLQCNPIAAIGTGSGAVCQQQPVCCTNVYQNGVINLGCSPVDLNL